MPYKSVSKSKVTIISGRDKPNASSNSSVRWTNREDRAMIRILTAYGYGLVGVAEYVGFTPETVRNITKRRLDAYANEDESQDYNFVSAAFKAKFPPLSPLESRVRVSKRGKRPKLEMVDVYIDGPRSRNAANSSSSHPRSILRQQGLNAETSASARNSSTTTNRGRSKGKKDDLIAVDHDPPEVMQDTSQSVIDFLLHLEHDLSGIFDTLKAQGLGTPTQLFAIAGWPEDTLHQLFKEVFPNMSVTQRFVLVKGLKDRA